MFYCSCVLFNHHRTDVETRSETTTSQTQTFEFVEELSLEHGVSEGLEERLNVLPFTRAQNITAQRNHTVLQKKKQNPKNAHL